MTKTVHKTQPGDGGDGRGLAVVEDWGWLGSLMTDMKLTLSV